MATAFINPTILPTRDASDLKIDGSYRTIEALVGNTPTLTVTLGASPQMIDCLWFGVDNVAKATISLDSTVIVTADDYAGKYPHNRGFTSFTSQDVTTITLAVTEKEDTSKPVRVSEVVAGTLLLALPNNVFRPNLTPARVKRGGGTHEMLGGGLRPYRAVNDADTKLDISYTLSTGGLEPETAEAFQDIYNDHESFYFVRDTYAHPLDGYLAVWGNESLPSRYSTVWSRGGQDVSFSVRESQ